MQGLYKQSQRWYNKTEVNNCVFRFKNQKKSVDVHLYYE